MVALKKKSLSFRKNLNVLKISKVRHHEFKEGTSSCTKVNRCACFVNDSHVDLSFRTSLNHLEFYFSSVMNNKLHFTDCLSVYMKLSVIFGLTESKVVHVRF